MALEARSVAAPGTDPPDGLPPHSSHFSKSVVRQQRVLTVAARIGAVVGGFFGVLSILIGHGGMWLGALSIVGTVVYLAIPLLYRFGELVAPVAFVFVA